MRKLLVSVALAGAAISDQSASWGPTAASTTSGRTVTSSTAKRWAGPAHLRPAPRDTGSVQPVSTRTTTTTTSQADKDGGAWDQ